MINTLTCVLLFAKDSAGLASMSAGAWLAWPSSAIKPLETGEHGFNLTTVEISTLVSLMDFGNMLSPIPSSYAMDAIGRKMTLAITAFLNLVASICVLAGNSVWFLYVARLFAGMGKGVTYAVVPIYLAEVANVGIRGALSTMLIGFLNVGMVYDYALGPRLTLTHLDYANLAIPTAFALTFFFFPESPHFLLMKGRDESAKNCMMKYRRVKREETGSDSLFDKEINNTKTFIETEMKNRGRFVDLFTSAGNRRALLIVSALALFQRGCGISPTIAYSTSIMPNSGGGVSASMYMVLFSIILVVANYVATPLVDRLGRKPLLIISSVSTGITTFIVSIYYYLERNTNVDVTNIQWLPYACLLTFSATYSIGIGIIPTTLVGELFPPNVKSYASSVCAVILALTSFLINTIFYNVAKKWGPHIMYWFFTFICVICAIFCVYLVVETKGKTFSEIQDILHGKNREDRRRTSH